MGALPPFFLRERGASEKNKTPRPQAAKVASLDNKKAARPQAIKAASDKIFPALFPWQNFVEYNDLAMET